MKKFIKESHEFKDKPLTPIFTYRLNSLTLNATFEETSNYDLQFIF
jgi:hypothetical protein